MNRAGTRGSAIVIVMAVVFVLVTIIMAMFSTSDVTRQALLRSHTDLLGRQKLQFDLAKAALGESAPEQPPWLDISLDRTLDRSLFLTSSFGSQPFQDHPDLGQPKELSHGFNGYPGNRYVRHRLPNGAQHLAVLSENLPYAAMSYASVPGSPSLDFKSVRPWLNPLWGESKQPLKAYSGTPPLLMAAGEVRVADFPYGFLYQAGNLPAAAKIQPSKDTGAVAFASDGQYRGVAAVDPGHYRETLRRQLKSLITAQTGAARAADQSLLLDQQISATDSMGMFFSNLAVPNSLKERLSLRESQSFWLPTIPALKKQFVIFWHVIFHVPAPPDGGLDGLARDARAALNELMKAVDALEKAKQALEDAQDWLDQANRDMNNLCKCSWNPVTWPCCAAIGLAKAALYAAKGAVAVAEAALTAAEALVLAIASPFTLTLEAILAGSGQMPTPASRREEVDYNRLTGGGRIDKGGADYWAYRQVFNGLTNFVGHLFSLQFEKVGRDLGNDVNVVLFGQMEKKQSWNFNDGLSARATWNVPPGRTFYYHRNLNIQGDLWVGRGATFVVKGDLRMDEGDRYGGNSQGKAEGTVHLEEGASLVVHGNFYGRGNAQNGSVLVGGPLGEIHGITSALLVVGNAYLPFGVVPGVGPDRLKGSPLSETFLKPLVQNLAPNLAKVDGPFHTRLPYIARYATTFEWITPPGIPFVIPTNFKNLHVIVFRGLTMVYAPTLNFELGEHLLTHTDWWGSGGEGRVPVWSKSVAVELKNAALAPALSPSPSVAHASVDKRAGQVGPAEVERFADALILKMTANYLQTITLESGIPLVSVGDLADKIFSYASQQVYNLDQREKALSESMPKGTDQLAGAMDGLWRAVEQAERRAPAQAATLAQECAGALVYAGGDLTVGSGSPLSSGFFVAEGNVRLECDVTVGSVVSLGGRVQGETLLYYPPFTQASIPVPPAQSADWKQRALNKGYTDGKYGVQEVGIWRPRLATEIKGGI